MQTKPIYLGVTYSRNYNDFHDSQMYTKGWNDAMHYIFDSDEEKQKKLYRQKIEEFKQRCTIIESEVEEDGD